MADPRTDWRETVQPDEAARFERLATQLRDAAARVPGGPSRALHAKGIAGVRAELVVPPGVPPAARVGIFATPGTYRAYVRFSNGSALHQPDAKPDVRGMAVKVLGVPGTKLIPGMESATTQDFLTIRNAFAPFRGPDEFVWVACEAGNALTFLPKALLHLGPARALRLIRTLATNLKVPYPSAAVSTFHSALAIRFGDYAVRYSIAAQDHSTPPPPGPGAGPDLVRDDLRARLARGPIHYEFRVQFYVGEDVTPIEDSSTEWPAGVSPFVSIARLTIPAQDLDSDEGRRLGAYVEQLSFNPWHAPVEFRPLGAMMRARSAAYRVSTRARGAAAEPEGADWLA